MRRASASGTSIRIADLNVSRHTLVMARSRGSAQGSRGQHASKASEPAATPQKAANSCPICAALPSFAREETVPYGWSHPPTGAPQFQNSSGSSGAHACMDSGENVATKKACVPRSGDRARHAAKHATRKLCATKGVLRTRPSMRKR